MKKFIKKNWLLIVALLAVGTFVEQKAVSAYQTSWLTNYTYQEYNGSRLVKNEVQGAYYGWNGALQSRKFVQTFTSGSYSNCTTVYGYPNAWYV